MKLEVLTPEKEALSSDVSSVYLQGSEGRLGILNGHTTLIAKLSFGMLEYEGSGGKNNLLCGDGLVEVQDDRVTVLVRSAEATDEIDVERAKSALNRAKSRRDSKDTDVDMVRAEAALQRALERLRYKGVMR
jgi:F-type H+-transporting ATPase subunit epsilon